jgi:ATP-dependent DNA helicase RecG
MEELQKGIIHNRRYRNRRIGDFLKELDMTEGRGTGIPIIRKEMAKNGSPEPRFETDEHHSYFITTLPIHSAFLEHGNALNGAIKGEEQSIQITDNKYYMFFVDSGGAINGVINGALNEAVINELVNVLRVIHNQKGINRIELIERIGKAKTTIERYLKILKENNLIEYRGAKKTGGYFLSEYALDKLKN